MQDGKEETSYVLKVWTAVGIVALTTVILLLLEATFSVFLLIFAGTLIAVFFRGFSSLIQRKTRWGENLSVGISIISSLVLMAAFFWLIGTQIQSQINELAETLPKTIERAENQLEESTIGDHLIERATSEGSSRKQQQFAGNFFNSTFGAFGDLYVVLFIGIFLTASPNTISMA